MFWRSKELKCGAHEMGYLVLAFVSTNKLLKQIHNMPNNALQRKDKANAQLSDLDAFVCFQKSMKWLHCFF